VNRGIQQNMTLFLSTPNDVNRGSVTI